MESQPFQPRTRPTTGGLGGAGLSGDGAGPVGEGPGLPDAGVLAAVAALAGVGGVVVDRLDAVGALAVAGQARLLASFAAAVEAQALSRLGWVYPLVEPGVRTGVERRRAVVAELQAFYGCSDRAAGNRLALAEGLAGLPLTVAALRVGRIDLPRARMMVERTAVLAEAADRAWVEARVLAAHANAPGGLTTRQWGRLLGLAVAAADPAA